MDNELGKDTGKVRVCFEIDREQYFKTIWENPSLRLMGLACAIGLEVGNSPKKSKDNVFKVLGIKVISKVEL